MKNLITCLTLSLLTSVAFAGNGTPDRGDCTPPPPFLFASTDECNAVILSWETIDNADIYSIYRSVTAGPSTAVLIGQTVSNVFVDTCSGGFHWYWVIALNDCGSSIPSNSALGLCVICNLWTVDDDGKADFNNIQAAVDAASDGDEIVVMPGTYTSTQDGHVVNMLGKALTLRSSDPSDPDVVTATIIDGEGARRGIACFNEETSKTIISGFTITNGYGVGFDYNGDGNIGWEEDAGGGMLNSNSSDPTLVGCTFTNNFSFYGGGMWNDNSSPTLTGCTFTGNTTPFGGGGMYNNRSSPTLTGCTFTFNSAWRGGGIRNDNSSSPMLTNCTFTGNSSTFSDGGGMYNYESNPMLENCTFTNNFSDGFGGGMYNHNSSPTLTDCTFTGNTAGDDGGGMWNGSTGEPQFGSSPTLTNCTFENNTAMGENGGGMLNNNSSNPTLTDCTFTGNTAYFGGGGGMYNTNSTPALTNCTFTFNSANYYGGGGMQNSNSNPTLTNCTFTNNFSDGFGGGMYNYTNSSPTLTDTTVCGNTPDQIYGGWIDNGGNTIADECPVVDTDGDGVPDDIDNCYLYNPDQLDCNGNGVGDVCDIADGTSTDINGNNIPDDCECLADINGDGYVNVTDLLAVIDQWGLTDSPADVNEDGIVDVSDLLIVVGSWGPCE